jgi:anion-transporting  ArsA/GET3 family ATPase
MVKKAHLVTGKGGVGKSLFAAVLAQHLSKNKMPTSQQILLTELNEHSFYRDYLNQPEINYQPSIWKQGIDVAQWAPEECLKEYALHLLKIESLYKLFMENPVTKSLIQIAPGLQDLALLGKMTSSPRKHGPPMKYDQIVVDSYSTGHFLAMLRAPSALNEAVPFGPMGEQSRSIDEYIRNPNFTSVHLVCLPEELPVSESIELYRQLQKEFGIKAHFYFNKMSELTDDDLKNLPEAEKSSLQNLIDNENSARQKISEAGIEFIELPLVTNPKIESIFAKLVPLLADSAKSNKGPQ